MLSATTQIIKKSARVAPVMARGIIKSVDGNEAAAHAAYACSDSSFIYPITPSSTMGELVDLWRAKGRVNAFGNVMAVSELEHEGGAAGALHGALSAGAMATTFTASQGLMLMLPNMYKIAGELMPCVVHVAARALAGQALSIFGDHSDVMAARTTGFCLLGASTVQEAADLAVVSHIATLEASLPFIHFFDGFRLSHEINKIDLLENEQIKALLPADKIKAFQDRALSPAHPIQKGTSQGPDIFFQMVESSNDLYNAVPEHVQAAMDKVSAVTGRPIKLFDYEGAEDAEDVVVVMGAGAPICEEASKYLNARGGKTGVLKVRLFRPWSVKDFAAALPKSVKRIAVLDRVKENGAVGEPLYEEVATSLMEEKMAGNLDVIVGGRFGLGSKEFDPAMARACFDNLHAEEPKNHFTVGINDDRTHTSLEVGESFSFVPEGTKQCQFWGMGSDGTVGANKDAIKIIGDNTDQYAQAYFVYDAKKSGGVTTSHLRFGPEPITSSYLVQQADFIGCHQPGYLTKYDVTQALSENGVFVLNSNLSDEELFETMPNAVKKALADKKAKFYVVDAFKVAEEAGLKGRINNVMQTAFFKLANVLPMEEAIGLLKGAIEKTYGAKGQKIVDMNKKVVDMSLDAVREVSVNAEWSTLPADGVGFAPIGDKFVDEVVNPIMGLKGDDLPVSVLPRAGVFPTGTAKFEKRGIATDIPEWIKETCTQCNQCAVMCPHAAVRPFISSKDESANAPGVWDTLNFRGKEAKDMDFRIQVSPFDCTGCGVCVAVCPTDSLKFRPAADGIEKESENWEYAVGLENRGSLFTPDTPKNTQFQQPLLEFSGACAGCGETPYVKMITQMFGERMVIANATGCSSIWGGTAPSNPYTTTASGMGPAWANSLFEDNAEYGYGMRMAQQTRRAQYVNTVNEALEKGNMTAETREKLSKWVEVSNNGEETLALYKELSAELDAQAGNDEFMTKLAERKDQLIATSQWIFGGDGWAYDIGYGGLDHVLASGENVNVLVMDTEMYSNTGGQMAKSTPKSAVVKFASGGKKTEKKDLALMAMTYDDVYVASVCMGADPKQCVRAFKEAEDYKGPSLIIGYSPCEGHTIKRGGLSRQLEASQAAVESGYWPLFRRNPDWAKKGKHVFKWDSKKEPNAIQEFLDDQARFDVLRRSNPELADKLQGELKEKTMLRNELYVKMAMNEAEFHEYLSSKYSEHE
eukprot:TRINITY_DN130_c0_g5_i2.p1 TRINITY_DN130_c0_g5~~TRINITY_DN130_c0_g5_i2.p1  ORF type:complete len:1209 (+),score=436.14 TRINITY_DN130_c0_g5_i2:75-3701(+)